MRNKRERGFTLVELVITIVVLSAALAGVLVVFTQAVSTSVDPELRAQSRAIARSYMEEILLQPYRDPETGDEGATEEGDDRAQYDDVWDYDFITSESPPRDRFGENMDRLSNYSVSVSVEGRSGPKRADITVTVSYSGSGGGNYTLHSARADY